MVMTLIFKNKGKKYFRISRDQSSISLNQRLMIVINRGCQMAVWCSPLTVNVINEEEAGTQQRNREIVGVERGAEDGQGGGGRDLMGGWGREMRRGGLGRMEVAGKCERLGRQPTRARARVWLCSFVRAE